MTRPSRSLKDDRLRLGTRGRILALLRRQPQTVDDLARELGVTDNAVRAQLGQLERDGLVSSAGSRKPAGAGKPAVLYHVPPEADAAFSQAYAPMLVSLVRTLADRMDAEALTALLVATGRRLAASHPVAAGDRESRLATALATLEELGGQMSVDHEAGRVVLRGSGCPLGEAVTEQREVCVAMQTFLEEMLGERLELRCSYEERPRCCFATEE